MPVYRLMINGENFLVERNGVLAKHGFYAWRSVEAPNPQEAELAAVQSLREEDRLRSIMRNLQDDPPTMHMQDIILLDATEPEAPTGFVWYAMTPPKRWWQFWKRA